MLSVCPARSHARPSLPQASSVSGDGVAEPLPGNARIMYRLLLLPRAGGCGGYQRGRLRMKKGGRLRSLPTRRQIDTSVSRVDPPCARRAVSSSRSEGPVLIGAAQSSLRLPIDSMYMISFPVSIESCFSGGISISKLVKSFMSIIWAVVPEIERTWADFRSTMGT